MPTSEYNVNIIISTRDKTSPAAKAATKSLGGLQQAAKLVAVAYAAMRVAQKTIEFVKLGAQAQAAEHRLARFAGGAKEAAEYLDALSRGSDYTIDRMTGMVQASRMLSTHMVQNTSEMEIAGAMVAKLGVQTWTTERRMSSLTMLLANQSIRRLDDFGLSVEAVRKRQEKLEAQGYSTEQAFKAAVFQEAEVALGTLGDTSALVATKIAALEGSWATLKQTVAKAVAVLFTSGDALEKLTNALIYADKYLRAAGESAEYTERSWLGLNAAAVATAGGIGVWREDEEALRATLEEKAATLDSVADATIRGTAVQAASLSMLGLNNQAMLDLVTTFTQGTNAAAGFSSAVNESTMSLGAQADAALRVADAVLSAAMSYSGLMQSMAVSEAGYYGSAADIEQRYAERVAQINKMGGGGGGAAARFFDEADLKRGLEIMRLQLAELEQARKDWDKTQAEGEPVFWYELSREDRKYLMETGKSLEDLALEREKSGDEITDLERAQMDDRIADLKREIKERKDLLKRGYYESHQIHVGAARADTEALLAEAAKRRDEELAALTKSRGDQELIHKQSLGRIVLAHFNAWAEMTLGMDGYTEKEVQFITSMRKDIAIEYELMTTDALDATGKWEGSFKSLWDVAQQGASATITELDKVIAKLDEMPDEKRIKIVVELATPSGRGALRQHGGPVKAGAPYIVGEAGPELFVPGSSGHVYNNTQTSNMTSNRTYNFPDARAMAFLSARERAQSRQAFASASGM